MKYTIDEIKSILRELLEYGDVIDCLYNNEIDHSFSADESYEKLKTFAEE